MKGGYVPKIWGRPDSILNKIPIAPFLKIDLLRNDCMYRSLVTEGQRVKMGDKIAETVVDEGILLNLPSPASGLISLISDRNSDEITSIRISEIDAAEISHPELIRDPSRLTPDDAQKIFKENGLWDYIWSSGTGGRPVLTGENKPRSIIINTIISEPFRTRGKVILKHFWHNIIKGVGPLTSLLADYGTIEFVLTQRRDPIVKQILNELRGKSYVKFHFVDVKYPIENPEILSTLIKKSKNSIKEEEEIWLLNIQTVEAIGACLGNGISVHKRIIALGGPAFPDPVHINVRIGTPLLHLIPETMDLSSTIVLHGGIFLGEQVDPQTASVGYDDDAYFFLPIKKVRDFVTFIRPGFNKKSIFPIFAGTIDRDISGDLRGELRPCVACGKCEEVCPVDLLPQIIHRYLYSDHLDEAQKMGIDNCIRCNLCTFVCPSKIELKMQFDEARTRLRREQEGVQ